MLLCKIREEVDNIFVHDSIYEYIAKISAKTRDMSEVALGISPRGSIAILKAAKANAYMNSRNYVVPDDIKEILLSTAEHRVILNTKAKLSGVKVSDIVNRILKETKVEEHNEK